MCHISGAIDRRISAKGGRSVGSEICIIEKIVKELKEDGWQEEISGITYSNGFLKIDLLKNGEVITIQYDFYPEKGILRKKWPDR